MQKHHERKNFDRQIAIDKQILYGGKWKKLCAYSREWKVNIQDTLEHYRENKTDKRDSNDFYQSFSKENSEDLSYGVSKLKDIKVHAIEEQAMRPIEKDLEKQAEQLRLQEAVLQRQELQLEKLAVYQNQCQAEGLEPIANIENIFSPENERSIVVLYSSQESADEATQNCKQEGFVFLSLEREINVEKEVNLSALEERKLLVCGSEAERQDQCEALQKHDNLFARETSWDFSEEHSRDFEMGFDSKDLRGTGTWQEVENKENEIDVQLGIEKEQEYQRGFELSL